MTPTAELEMRSTMVVRGVLGGDLDALGKLGPAGGFVNLEIAVRVAMKGRPGNRVRFRAFVPPEAKNKHGLAPTLESLRELLAREEDEREVVVFLTSTGRSLYLADPCSSRSLGRPEREVIVETMRCIQRHRKLRETELESKDIPTNRRVREAIQDLVSGSASREHATRVLRKLGDGAIVPIIAHLNDRRELPPLDEDPVATGKSAPQLAVDALCATLSEITGISFGLDWHAANDAARAHEVSAWRVFAHYANEHGALPRMRRGKRDRFRIDVVRADVTAIASAVELYMQRNRLQIPTMDKLLAKNKHGHAWIQAPKDGLLDPWGIPYEIRRFVRMRFDVVSAGPDRLPGTGDDVSYLRHAR